MKFNVFYATMSSHRCIDTSNGYEEIYLTLYGGNCLPMISSPGINDARPFDTLCEQCCKCINVRRIIVNSSYHINDTIFVDKFLLLACTHTKHLSISLVDCSNIIDELCNMIALNTIPTELVLRRCNLDVDRILSAAITNTNIKHLEIVEPHRCSIITYHRVIEFIKNNATCITFKCQPVWPRLCEKEPEVVNAIRGNFTLTTLNEVTCGNPYLYKENHWIQDILNRNSKYQIGYVVSKLIDITLAFAPMIADDTMPPYVLVVIFDFLEPHYETFWVREKIAIVFRIKRFIESLTLAACKDCASDLRPSHIFRP